MGTKERKKTVAARAVHPQERAPCGRRPRGTPPRPDKPGLGALLIPGPAANGPSATNTCVPSHPSGKTTLVGRVQFLEAAEETHPTHQRMIITNIQTPSRKLVNETRDEECRAIVRFPELFLTNFVSSLLSTLPLLLHQFSGFRPL